MQDLLHAWVLKREGLNLGKWGDLCYFPEEFREECSYRGGYVGVGTKGFSS